MINTSLDRKYVAKEGGQTNFDPIPEGDYRLRVKEIDPWKSTIKTIETFIYNREIIQEMMSCMVNNNL